MLFNLTYQKLKSSEKSVFSQKGQDGVIEAIFSQLNANNKFCIEFGAGDGKHLSNTANLENKGWERVLFDVDPKSEFITHCNITAENINDVFNETNIPYGIDYLSIDIDGNDLWVWEALKKMPKVVSIEYNSKFENNESFAIKYNPDHKWDGDDYYSASLLALKRIGERKGYRLVYVVDELDAFFIRRDLISKEYKEPDLNVLLPKPIIAHKPSIKDRQWIEIL